MRKIFIIINAIFVSALFANQTIINNNDLTKLKINTQDELTLNVSIELGDILITEESPKNHSEKTFIRLNLPGFHKSLNVGQPELPEIHRLIEIPSDANPVININSSEVIEIFLDDYNISSSIFPTQAPISKSQSIESINFQMNESIYQKNKYILDGETVAIEDEGMLRAVRVGNLIVKPVNYNPINNSLIIHKNLDFDINFEGADITKTQTLKNKYYSPYFEPIYNQLANYQPLNRDDLITYPVTYVIISDASFSSALGDFIDWKTQKGYNVIVGYTNSIGASSSSIENFLKDLYNNPADGVSPPSFVLLAGDVSQVPASYSSGGHVSDLNYASYTGDFMPEVFHGRFSANSASQLTAQVNKTIQYERYEMPDPSFLGEVVMISGVDGSFASQWGNGQINYGTEYYFNSDHGIYSNTYLYPASGSAASQIRSDISQGAGYVNYTAHGYEQGWADPSFTNSDVNNLTNNGKYPLMVGNCCLTNAFDTGECFGEALLRAQNKGAIGYIGGSDVTYWDEDYWWGVGSGNITTYPSYNQTGAGAYDVTFHEGNEDMWAVVNSALMLGGNLAVQEAGASLSDYYWEIYHLMGDPSLSTYYGVPNENNVSHLPFLQVGVSSFTISADPHSYVAVYKDGVLHGAGLVSESGSIDLEIDPIYSGGPAQITVTAQNKQPYIQSVEVGSADGAFMAVNDYTVETADGVVTFSQYGPVNLSVSLENFGSESASSVSASLSTTCPYISIVDGNESFGTIASGAVASSTNSFSFEVNPNIPNEYPIDLVLQINSGNESWEQSINLTGYSPVIEVESVSGNLSPGSTSELSINLSNNGGAPINYPIVNIQGGPYVNILSSSFPNAYYWDCGSDCAVNSGIDNTEALSVVVQISSSAPIGSLADFVITTTMLNNEEFSNIVSLSLPIGIITENFSDGFNGFEWSFQGNSNWIESNESNELDGSGSVRSGDINDNQSSSISVNLDVTIDGEISFFKKVSSEANYDYLRFYVDGSEKGSWSGEQGWTEETFAVSAGNHTFKWEFDKDSSVSNGSDCAWIDQITFPPVYVEPEFILGDANYDLIINILDVILIINMVLGIAEDDLLVADLNSDGAIDILDIVQTVNVIVGLGKASNESIETGSVLKSDSSIQFSSNAEVAGLEIDYSGLNFEIVESSIPDGWLVEYSENKIILIDLNKSGHNGSKLFDYKGTIDISNVLMSDWNGNGLKAEIVNIDRFSMSDAYPNPFNPTTQFDLVIANDGLAKIKVYNIVGQEIDNISNNIFEAGIYNVSWDASRFPSGIYFINVEQNSNIKSQKVILVK